MFAVLLQLPDQPCALCGEDRTVSPVSPCGHLVCQNCWAGADYSACPICHRRIDPADPFGPPARPPPDPSNVPPPVEKLRLLVATDDPVTDGTELLHDLLARQTPLAPQDRKDVLALLDVLADAPAWLPEVIPVRESRALVTARHPDLLDAYADTATDVRRFLCVVRGGAPGLCVARPRRLSRAR